MTLSWRYFLLICIALLVLLNFAQSAVNTELVWRLDQFEKAVQMLNLRQGSDAIEQDSARPEMTEI